MTQSLSGNISLQFIATLQANVGLALASQAPIARKVSIDFADGAGAGAAHMVYSAAAESIAASGSKTYDLNASLTDAFGTSIVATKLKALLIVADANNANDLLVGAAGSNPLAGIVGDAASDIIVVKPGGVLLLVAPQAAGYAVAAGSADVLKIANSSSGTAVVYDIAALLA